ncbi:peptidoglycan DD-metalloendopeptidase family protein [Lentibacillus sp. N15]|uniref:peptidoglycan DD-metalloendopeptidase family protein n=1 Tax=Lentibacillus songyuanensis TaxID=3136161 RepID=UPI0031BBC6DA
MKKILIILGVALSGLIITLVLLVMIVPVLISSTFDEIDSTSAGEDSDYVVCNKSQRLNKTKWNKAFEKGGILSSKGNYFITSAEEHNIDPVLFAAIAMHETAWGTSNAVKNYNNPGGLMDPSTNSTTLFKYSSLEEGIDAMGKTLDRLVNTRGLVTINDLGSVYAPLDADNDPNGLNTNWVPVVNQFAAEFGGLTMNCEIAGEVEIVGDKAWVAPYTKNLTSGFRPPDRPDHNGIDIAWDGIHGKPAVAFMDGTVTVSAVSGTTFYSTSERMGNGYGYFVAIDHGNGFETRYAHLMEQGVPAGTKVKAGEQIGKIGSTGGSTGPHLHFEVLVSGEKVNPMQYVKEFISKK